MKSLIVAIILCSCSLFAQVDKGRVSLMFDDDKIDIPVTSINIMKDENLRISFRAEKSDSLRTQWASMELTLSKLSAGENVSPLQDFRIQIQSSSKTNMHRKSFIFNYGKGNEKIQLYNDGDIINWSAPNSFHFLMDIGSIKYDGKELKINGTFSVNVNKLSEDKKIKAEVHINDGKFEVVL